MKTDISPAPADLEAQIGMLSKKISASRFGKLRRAASLRTRRATLVLEDIFQPHNGAAVLRTADAFGLKEVHVIESRYKFRASAQVDTGASKWLEVHKYPCGDGRFPRNVKILKHSPLPKGCRENVAKALGEIRNMGYMLAASVPDSARGVRKIWV